MTVKDRIAEIIYDVKEKLTSQEYKDLMELVQQIPNYDSLASNSIGQFSQLLEDLQYQQNVRNYLQNRLNYSLLREKDLIIENKRLESILAERDCIRIHPITSTRLEKVVPKKYL